MAYLSEYCEARPPRPNAPAVSDAFAAYARSVEREAAALVALCRAPLAERPYGEPDTHRQYNAARAAVDTLYAAVRAACRQ